MGVEKMVKDRVPEVTFKTRVRDANVADDNPYRWQDRTSEEYFSHKKVILFSLPGAFTPTCSTYQLPGFEKLFQEFKNFSIDAIYCMSVNDAFTMNAWASHLSISNVELIPDGSGEFTRKIGMLVSKDNLGFGMRSWRFAAIINDGLIEPWFEEPGNKDNSSEDPYGVSAPENVLQHLNS